MGLGDPSFVALWIQDTFLEMFGLARMRRVGAKRRGEKGSNKGRRRETAPSETIQATGGHKQKKPQETEDDETTAGGPHG